MDEQSRFLLGSPDDLGRTYQYLIDSLSTGANICLICIDVIEKTDAVRTFVNIQFDRHAFLYSRFGTARAVTHHFISCASRNGSKMEFIRIHPLLRRNPIRGIGEDCLKKEKKVALDRRILVQNVELSSIRRRHRNAINAIVRRRSIHNSILGSFHIPVDRPVANDSYPNAVTFAYYSATPALVHHVQNRSMSAVTAINLRRRHVVAVSKAGHAGKSVRNCYRVNSIAANKYGDRCRMVGAHRLAFV